jgi:hypothetical protein
MSEGASEFLVFKKKGVIAECTRERERERESSCSSRCGGGLIDGKMKGNIWVIFEGLFQNFTFPMKTQVSTSLFSCTATAITGKEEKRERESQSCEERKI